MSRKDKGNNGSGIEPGLAMGASTDEVTRDLARGQGEPNFVASLEQEAQRAATRESHEQAARRVLGDDAKHGHGPHGRPGLGSRAEGAGRGHHVPRHGRH